jgi:hypothetical protein
MEIQLFIMADVLFSADETIVYRQDMFNKAPLRPIAL